ncbi:MAG: hypothetical protein HFI42_13095 [Lachnospiraceae bacterium]|nr:hypothetical protein [Lachnospiraceae bacterium]MCI9151405.1 hypothetical protein [Lachnospiraceae bacterium]
MAQYDAVILNGLLDRYEASLLSVGENQRNIHIDFPFQKSRLPVYFNESSAEYEKIHVSMKALEDRQLIRILWKGNREGHIISKVRLNMEQLEEAYRYVGRMPKGDMAANNSRMLEEYLSGDVTPVCRAFLEYLRERLIRHQSVKEFIRLEDMDQTRQLLDTLQAIERNRTQLYLREFSMVHFQDSKAFEKLEGRILHVFRRFLEGAGEMEADEILAEYGIYCTPNYVYVKGRAALAIGEERIHLSAWKQGIGISGDDIGRLRLLGTDRIKKVITIENLTTFFRWQEEDSLMVYLGGYHNALRRSLLSEIYSCCPRASYFHFGDIDAGGFEIYRDLREKTGIPFERYHMDLETLKKYEGYGRPLTENDKRRLERMADREELQEVIAYMLEHGVKLEQECIGLAPLA